MELFLFSLFSSRVSLLNARAGSVKEMDGCGVSFPRWIKRVAKKCEMMNFCARVLSRFREKRKKEVRDD